MLWIIFAISILGLVYAGYLVKEITKIKLKNKKVEEVASHIHKSSVVQNLHRRNSERDTAGREEGDQIRLEIGDLLGDLLDSPLHG